MKSLAQGHTEKPCLSRPFPRTETREGSAPCGPFLGIIVSSQSPRKAPWYPLASPHQATGTEQRSRDCKVIAQGHPAVSTLRIGFRSPRS